MGSALGTSAGEFGADEAKFGLRLRPMLSTSPWIGGSFVRGPESLRERLWTPAVSRGLLTAAGTIGGRRMSDAGSSEGVGEFVRPASVLDGNASESHRGEPPTPGERFGERLSRKKVPLGLEMDEGVYGDRSGSVLLLVEKRLLPELEKAGEGHPSDDADGEGGAPICDGTENDGEVKNG